MAIKHSGCPILGMCLRKFRSHTTGVLLDGLLITWSDKSLAEALTFRKETKKWYQTKTLEKSPSEASVAKKVVVALAHPRMARQGEVIPREGSKRRRKLNK